MTTLGSKAVRGGGATLLGQLVKVFLQLAGLVVLGRILSPTDFGLVAMVTAIVGVADVIRDAGLSSAAIQAKSLSAGQRNNLFWLNSGIGLALMGAICLAAWPIAVLYGDQRLIVITLALAPMFLFNGVQTQFQAHLARDLRFVALTASDILSMAVGLAAAIGTALAGFGYWALVFQLLAQSLTLLIARTILARWRPGLPDRSAPTKEFVKFGVNLMGSQLLVYASSNVPSIIVGNRFGATQLGFFGRASQLVTFPMNQLLTPITNVALPVLARSQDSRIQYERHLLNAQIALSYAVAGVLSLAIVWADPLIPLIFGDQWQPSAPLFQILAVAGLFQAVSYGTYWVFLSMGLTQSHFRYSLISRSLLIVTVLVGSLFGLYGVAVGYVAGVALGWPLSLLWLHRHRVAPIRRMLMIGIRALFLAVLVTAAGLAAALGLESSNDFVRLALSAVVVIVAAGLLVLVIPPMRADARVIITTLGHFRSRG